ncbi:SH2 domain-containing protein 4A isoform X1 [Rattus norvegicus]|uniref:SH2 domain-containing protein 4A n=1 Tax=Rattus norvegicus TaxID=10116 RepID=SH24A_RAT|nr:SH2 domain-containing protein 4A [Rattus norvegicus]XP_038950424.1 SH2 domain-containing protein 4A isoform X1 [Rattus norvegicus]Q6AYC8.1 RecName: Full=SH2 domain-containing protein 4A [Rattus norvegicus]AAH79100.1 SH2 domain containing 4A [Rattus norvegicus]|eukprot:NP_001012048.1 SH2 domain-containing protein 4A [Rattus norvegicus]
MLRQILSEMFIDPDLLAELSEEQKQILFYKMREEQIRRWKEREAAMERKESLPVKSRPKKENGKSVHWKLGADKQVWVWVMGEHHLDKPYDVLCDEILAEREHLRAAKDAELRKAQSLQFTNSLKVKSLNCDLQAVKKTEPQNVTRKAAAEEATDQGPRAIPTKKDDKAQTKDLTKKKDSEELKQTEDEKTKQIYKNWKEDSEWQASLRKSKAADEKRRSLAKQAREDYKRLSQRGRSGDGLQNPLTGPQKPKRPPLPPKPQFLQPLGSPPKSLGNQGVIRTKTSSTQEDIIRWFKEEQLPFRAGYQKNSDTIAPWFHGILTLKKANELLSTGMPGSFLIRVSEKIKGYALSYLSEEGCKHFLIDASANSYSFLGVDQLQHATLADLVEYHKEEPITSLGKELLLFPCGQQDKPPDYLELFQ